MGKEFIQIENCTAEVRRWLVCVGAGCWVLGAGCWVLGAGCFLAQACPCCLPARQRYLAHLGSRGLRLRRCLRCRRPLVSLGAAGVAAATAGRPLEAAAVPEWMGGW